MNKEQANENLCTYLADAFKTYAHTGSRSPRKLEYIHGGIAHDIRKITDKLGEKDGHKYSITSKGYEENKEAKVKGIDMEKDCDITVFRDGEVVLVVMVKMVLGNYSQNSINYFDTHKGETDNLQAEGIPVFQLTFIKDKAPYFKTDGTFDRWEHLSKHNFEKYCNLGKRTWGGPDNPCYNSCVPFYSLLCTYHLNDMPDNPSNSEEYKAYYRENDTKVTLPDIFDDMNWGAVTYNDYSQFIEKVETYLTEK